MVAIARRDEFTDEEHATTFATTDVASQVELREVRMPRPTDSEHPRIQKIERHQRTSGQPVGGKVGDAVDRKEGLQKLGIDRVVDHPQIDPARGQELSSIGGCPDID